MKYSELIKQLKKLGCHMVRHGARHDIWYSPITGKQFPIPRHSSEDIKPGTYNSIKDDAGL